MHQAFNTKFSDHSSNLNFWVDTKFFLFKFQELYNNKKSLFPSNLQKLKFERDDLDVYFPDLSLKVERLNPRGKRRHKEIAAGIYLQSYSALPQLSLFFNEWTVNQRLSKIFGDVALDKGPETEKKP